jgi:hypothetical protein
MKTVFDTLLHGYPTAFVEHFTNLLAPTSRARLRVDNGELEDGCGFLFGSPFEFREHDGGSVGFRQITDEPPEALGQRASQRVPVRTGTTTAGIDDGRARRVADYGIRDSVDPSGEALAATVTHDIMLNSDENPSKNGVGIGDRSRVV